MIEKGKQPSGFWKLAAILAISLFGPRPMEQVNFSLASISDLITRQIFSASENFLQKDSQSRLRLYQSAENRPPLYLPLGKGEK